MMIAAAAFACRDDGGVIAGNTVTVAVENGASHNGQIDTVKLVIERGDDGNHVIASLPYGGGNFTVNLPASVNDSLLKPMEYLPAGITTSNRGVKGEFAFLYACKSGQLVGQIYHGTEPGDGNNLDGYLFYLNGDVSITGTRTHPYRTANEYRVNGKKGWNMLYITRCTNLTSRAVTTGAPAGAKWYFFKHDDPVARVSDGNE
jgi:hypothetical protein